MTRGKWLILALLIILAALLTLAVKEKRGEIANRPAPDLAKKTVPAIPRRMPVKKTKKIAPEIREQSEKMNGQSLQVIVQNENGEPLAEARIRTKVLGGKNQTALTNFNLDLKTDANGVAAVLWPLEKIKQLQLSASKKDYSTRKMTWDFDTGDSVPPSYTIKLKKGFRIGGIIVDPEGNPISEAKVSVHRFWGGEDEAPRKKGEQPAFSSKTDTTGADGRWSMAGLPLELINNISADVKHTNFIGAYISLNDPKIEKELREETHKLVLKRGLEVFGRVLDEQERPIARAKVWAGRKYWRDRKETKTDEQGGFVFRNVSLNEEGQESGGTLFSVMADGYEPASQTQKVGTNAAEIVFHLKPGVVIAGKVVGKEGEPIQGVRVVLEGNSDNGERYEGYEFSKTTDKDGKFEWKGAPNQPMPFYIGKMGYQQKRGVSLKPGAENVVTLSKARQVQGHVLNAETGQPVTQFRVAVGQKMDERFYNPQGKDFTSAEGFFTIDVGEENENGIQASAKDYAEQIQILPKTDGDSPTQVDFKLKPSPALEGIVITLNGQPVTGASVALVEENFGGKSVQFSNGRMRTYGSGSKIAKTDETGHFEISSPPENGTIVASGDEGFASTSIAEVRSSGRLTLQLFGRIEGVLLAPNAEGQEVLLGSPGGGISFDLAGYKAAVDANGHFAFEKVPPGALSIVRLVKTTARSWEHSHSTPVTVTPGQTSLVTLGGVDATLQGSVRFETEPTETDLILTGSLHSSMPQIQVPPGLSAEERMALFSSSEWKEQMKNVKHYSVLVGKDGSLVLDSVVPGDYTLTVTANKASEESFREKTIARGETKVTVPVGSGPTSPINVGEIILKLVKSNPSQAPSIFVP